MSTWAHDVLQPLARQKIALALDEGIRRNDRLFAGALKPIRGVPD
ncbi:hypothetical protein [Komagataeibacter melomenusus]|nr:hypothetical protein [Komagataeibacter melomenusus]